MNSFTELSVTDYNYSIFAELMWIGPDLLIVIMGGDHPHIGSVSTTTKTTATQTFKFPSHDGRLHKDNYLSDRIIQHLNGLNTGNWTILAGLHVDHISRDQLAAAGQMTDQLASKIKAWILKNPSSTTLPTYYKPNEKPQ